MRIVLEPDDGGYVAWVPELPGCFTQGATVEEAMERAPEAISVHLEGLREADPDPEFLAEVKATVERLERGEEPVLMHTEVVKRMGLFGECSQPKAERRKRDATG